MGSKRIARFEIERKGYIAAGIGEDCDGRSSTEGNVVVAVSACQLA